MSERLSDLNATAALGPEDGADFWLVRREGGHDIAADPDFASWLAASLANAEAWRRSLAAWDRAGSELSDPLLQAMRRDALEARPQRRWTWPTAVAAGLATLVLAGALGWSWISPPSRARRGEWVAAAAAATYSNGAALPRMVRLSDGAQVTLDAGSAIAVAYDDHRRGVRLLRGRAYFDVVHDPARPFRVEVEDRRIDDLGTRFDVGLADHALTVTLMSGSVSVNVPRAARPTVLKPGQQLAIAADGASRMIATDPAGAMAWRSGLLVFRNIPLAEALVEINRYGGPPVTATDVGDLRISGSFRAGDPPRFARSLAAIYPLQVEDRPNGGVTLARRTAP